MSNLSHTQEYYLCAINKKGDAPALSATTVFTCLIVSGITELLRGGYLARNEKKQLIADNSKPLADELPHIKPLYEKVISFKKPQTIKNLVETYENSLWGKEWDAYMLAIGSSLFAVGAVDKFTEKGFFRNKTKFAPKQNAVTQVTDKVRREFLGDANIAEDTLILAALLDNSGVIKTYFNKEETCILKTRLKEVRESETNITLKSILNEIEYDFMLSAIIFSTVFTGD